MVNQTMGRPGASGRESQSVMALGCNITEAWIESALRKRGRIEGGEALPGAILEQTACADQNTDRLWHVLWTHSHCEQLVRDQLAAKEFDVFLPKMEIWSRRAGVRRLIRVPMFPGYLFLHHRLDKKSYLEVAKARGLVSVLGERWDRLEAVSNREVEAIQRLTSARLPVLPHPYLRVGERVRIARGPLADVEGILVRAKPNKGLLVLSIDLLERAVSVEIDCTLVTAA